ncbi:MAG: cytochrome d ubiquinol oxidase subunit II [Armatimonadota bacterium]
MMEPTILQSTWFWLIGILIAGYTLLDGFDLGMGWWMLTTKDEKERNSLMNAIMPYWDGNEVWLITAGGALFAAFPPVYATVFSGFYLAMMLVLFALIMRAISIEFRHQLPSAKWQHNWGQVFGISSLLASLLFGVAAGNLLWGIPMNAEGDFTGTLLTLLNPIGLFTGVVSVAFMVMHAGLFGSLRTTGELKKRILTGAQGAWGLFAVLLAAYVGITAARSPLMASYHDTPLLYIFPVLAFGLTLGVGVAIKYQHLRSAFTCSGLSILLLFVCMGLMLFPNMVYAVNNPQFSLSAANASSSELTLKTMSIITAIMLPIVLAYTIWIHRTFRGTVTDELHY